MDWSQWGGVSTQSHLPVGPTTQIKPGGQPPSQAGAGESTQAFEPSQRQASIAAL
jgi:hypothetical protein